MSIKQRKRLGDLLVESNLITEEQLANALKLQKSTGKKLGELLIDEGVITEKQMIEVLEFQFGIPHVDLSKYFIDPEIPRLISENLAKKHLLIPVRKERGHLVVAMADPLNIFAMDDVKIASGMEVEPVIATKQGILNSIEKYYGRQVAEQAIEDFRKQNYPDGLLDINDDSPNEINNAPVVRLVNSFIKQAVLARASDIHMEPFEHNLRIRFRIDGDLQEIMTTAKSTHSAIVTRIKIMGKMDIAEKRIPQDGRIETLVDGREVDLRISVLPTVHGEKVVIRLLDRSSFLLSKNDLGLTEANAKLFEKIVKQPNGMILVTGPTGSGKTTTLYTVLRELNQITKNIITVEDPVEYRLNGVNQVQVNNKAGMTFANGLRSILRQDPDIIMVGEIRDTETAHIAVRASITGHLVLSTMHTNDTAATISRLLDMDIEAYLVSSALVGVVAQRLVRKICESCKYSYEGEMKELELLGLNEPTKLFKGKGCSLCSNTGYRGRTAIHEIMAVTKEIRKLIDLGASMDDLRKKSKEQGTLSLKENCRELVIDGQTTVEELIRAAYTLE